jgi:anti-sigma B factor antagonist
MGLSTHPPTEHGWHQWDRAGFRVHVARGCAVVAAHGDIDLESAGGFDRAVHNAFRSSRHVIIDLSQVNFIDSSGLGVLVTARRDAEALDGSVSLVQPPPVVQRILIGTQLQQSFTVFSTLDEAIQAAQTP